MLWTEKSNQVECSFILQPPTCVWRSGIQWKWYVNNFVMLTFWQVCMINLNHSVNGLVLVSCTLLAFSYTCVYSVCIVSMYQAINNSDHWTWFIHHANYKITDKHTPTSAKRSPPPPPFPMNIHCTISQLEMVSYHCWHQDHCSRLLLQCYCSKAQSSMPLGAIAQLLSLIHCS